MLKNYQGTRLGRQELDAQILEDIGALWKPQHIDQYRIPADEAPGRGQYDRLVVAMDPASTANLDSDETGIVVVALLDSDYYVLEDLSLRAGPHECLEVAIDAYNRHEADCLVAEKNALNDYLEAAIRATSGGDLVEYRGVTSTKNKKLRAQKPSGLYQQGRVHHVGLKEILGLLEEQMCNFTGKPSDRSPDRMDALVHGLTDLMEHEGDDDSPPEFSAI